MTWVPTTVDRGSISVIVFSSTWVLKQSCQLNLGQQLVRSSRHQIVLIPTA